MNIASLLDNYFSKYEIVRFTNGINARQDKAFAISTDQGMFKVRVFTDNETAKRVVSIMEHLRSQGFDLPKIIACKDNVLIKEYVQGKILSEVELTPRIIDESARLLASLHNAEFESLGLEPDNNLSRFYKHVNKLVETGLITQELGDKFKSKYDELMPDSFEYCICHLDFQPGNLVLNSHVRMIDFESLNTSVKGVCLTKPAIKFGMNFFDYYSKYADASTYLNNKDLYDLRYFIGNAVSVYRTPRNYGLTEDKVRERIMKRIRSAMELLDK